MGKKYESKSKSEGISFEWLKTESKRLEQILIGFRIIGNYGSYLYVQVFS